MESWQYPPETDAKIPRVTKLGSERDAAREISDLTERIRKEFPKDPQRLEDEMLQLMKQWGGNDQTYNMPRIAARVWVMAHENQVKVASSKYRLRLSCYERADFLSEAVISALKASDVSIQENEPFEKWFWSLLRINLKQVSGESVFVQKLPEDEDGNKDDNIGGSRDNAPDRLIEKKSKEELMAGERKALYFKWAGWIMSQKEFDAWSLYMSPERPTTEEIGHRLGISRQGADHRINKAEKKVNNEFRAICLTFDRETGEVTSGHKLLLGANIEDMEIGESAKPKPVRKRRAKSVEA